MSQHLGLVKFVFTFEKLGPMPNKGLKVPLLALVSLIAVYLSWGKSRHFFSLETRDVMELPSPLSIKCDFLGDPLPPLTADSGVSKSIPSVSQAICSEICILPPSGRDLTLAFLRLCSSLSLTLSLHVSEANIRRPHIRRSKRTRTYAKTLTPDASGARSPIHLPNEPGPTCMTRGLGSGNDAVASWSQGPRGDNNWPVEEPRDLGPREPPRLGVLSPSPCLHPRREGFKIGPLLPRAASKGILHCASGSF